MNKKLIIFLIIIFLIDVFGIGFVIGRYVGERSIINTINEKLDEINMDFDKTNQEYLD
jgi:hypothetical protein